MSLRLLHTADWQLGRTFGRFPAEVARVLEEERFRAVERIAALARERAVDAVLVAGDVFDHWLSGDRVVHRLIEATRGFEGPWLLLPGNHDPAVAGGVWERLAREGATHLRILATPEPVEIAGGAGFVLPAPLRERHTADDPTAWMDAAATPAGAIRIGLAHGSVRELLPADAGSANPVARDRAERAGLDWLALGDWHGTLRVGPRSWYAGTPEPDRFRANEPGNLLSVEIAAPGVEPAVEVLPVGHFLWRDMPVPVHGGDAVEALAAGLAAIERPDRVLLQLRLEGTVDLETRAAIDAVLGRHRERLRHLELDDAGLLVLPTESDLQRFSGDPVLQQVAEALAGDAAGEGERADVARLALRLLHFASASTERR
jgi:DNA repair exonuclease SbcCD nuclease subunit